MMGKQIREIEMMVERGRSVRRTGYIIVSVFRIKTMSA